MRKLALVLGAFGVLAFSHVAFADSETKVESDNGKVKKSKKVKVKTGADGSRETTVDIAVKKNDGSSKAGSKKVKRNADGSGEMKSETEVKAADGASMKKTKTVTKKSDGSIDVKSDTVVKP